jgi:CheY-like chemotaxis protein
LSCFSELFVVEAVNLPHSRFVVIEDSTDDASILTHLLQRAGGPVVSVFHSAEAAIEALEVVDDASLPTALFIDVGLPGISGFEILRWIRKDERFQSVYVLLLSASDEPRNLGKAVQLGADGFLVKFPSPSAVRELVAELERPEATARPRATLSLGCNLLLAAG